MGTANTEPLSRWPLSSAAALGIHVALFVAALRVPPPTAANEPTAAPVEVDLVRETPSPEPPAPAPVESPPLPVSKATEPLAPAPRPAEATKVLTQSPAAPIDLTGDAFATGESQVLTYGQVSAAGVGTAVTFSPQAKVGGSPGGTGTLPARDMSRAPTLRGGSNWDCPFPREADAAQIDQAVVKIIVTVSAAGRPLRVDTVSDPGFGFAGAAKACAQRRTYEPGTDSAGAPLVASTPPITVRFTR